MPSDPAVARVLELAAGAQARCRAAIGAAADQIGEYLDRHHPGDGAAAAVPSPLGRFAAGRIDEARFTALFNGDTIAPAGLEPMRRAATALADVLAQDDSGALRLPRGGDLTVLVERALARTGRAFGAALLFQAARSGSYRPDQHDQLLGGIPFPQWNRSERQLAPPLVIRLEGSDLQADGLAACLDGGVKILLLVDPPCPPAPLVRLITPGIFVMQTADPDEMGRLLAHDGPAIGALVPDGAARFVHDPAGGPTLGRRLTVSHLPADPPRSAAGGRSAWQQREELTQLALLADLATLAVAPAGGSVAGRGHSVDALASWLLAQAGLSPAAGAPVP